ncbi:MAG: hypothetical protein OXH50_06065 [Gemmatimonadetes bacterium]|nr:hypothetical protein [Gemmatimonadota bacterium]
MARRDLPFTNRNWIIFGGGVAVIAVGYGLLSIPPADGFLSLTMAPILLVLGYCVVIPLAILYRDPGARKSPAVDREAG